MAPPSSLVELLNQATSHSPEVVARALDLSVEQAIQRMQEHKDQGMPLNIKGDSQQVVSYALSSNTQLLDAERIADHLSPVLPLDSFDVFSSLASTNSYLLGQNTTVGRTRVCLTESQTEGRGRRGNTWLSAPYRNIMMSMSWCFDTWPSKLTALGLAVALAVTEELNKRYHLSLEIKWPNDIMSGDQKLAGILVDVAGDPAGACTVVLGLGLNVDQPNWSQQANGAYQWQDLNGLGVKVDRNVLVANIINAWLLMLRTFSSSGFSTYTEQWNRLSCYSQRLVKVSGANFPEPLEGKMIGVDSAGGLLLLDAGGVQHIITDSTASLRLMVAD